MQEVLVGYNFRVYRDCGVYSVLLSLCVGHPLMSLLIIAMSTTITNFRVYRDCVASSVNKVYLDFVAFALETVQQKTIYYKHHV